MWKSTNQLFKYNVSVWALSVLILSNWSVVALRAHVACFLEGSVGACCTLQTNEQYFLLCNEATGGLGCLLSSF